VWTHDFAPAFDTAGCDDDRCIVVGVPNEATPATLEYCLGTSVALVDPATRMAGDLADHPDCWLRRQPKTRPEPGIETLVRVVLSVYPMLYIAADNHEAALLQGLRVASNAAASESVGSMRTLTTCFTIRTLDASTDSHRVVDLIRTSF
jgi:hypothetical protein